AVMAVNEGPLEDYCCAGADPWPVAPPPIIGIPTTAGTGAEVSAAAMLNLVSEHRKVDLFGDTILPVTAILDPELTVGLPPNLTALTGIDALNHAFEAYIAIYANSFTDMLAEKAIELAVNNIRKVYKDPTDLEARGNMLIASAMAVMSAGAGLGVIHSLAQTIGGYYDDPHGLAIAVSFVPGTQYNLSVEQKKLGRISQIMGTDISGMTEEEAAKSVIPALQYLLKELDVPTGFDSLGVKENDIPELAKIAMLDGCTPFNPRPLDEQAFIELFQLGLDG
ncbi:MAG: iron-containing alcohol dehydrogenase, partial [Anaerolineales bacterium]|nr:iron-containing alcohol dehydrogenase [Anaerolineales bacterium]